MAIVITIAVWGRTVGVISGTNAGVGWVRCRDTEGQVWLHVADKGDNYAVTYPQGINAFIQAVKTRKTIDTRYWIQETGPEGQDTSQDAEHWDASF